MVLKNDELTSIYGGGGAKTVGIGIILAAGIHRHIGKQAVAVRTGG